MSDREPNRNGDMPQSSTSGRHRYYPLNMTKINNGQATLCRQKTRSSGKRQASACQACWMERDVEPLAFMELCTGHQTPAQSEAVLTPIRPYALPA
mmetsp:Transcript_28187/g.86142  ORF Transcript_28187/g.86142 Transcript_28187/m.86142 type:complete len:96 (+) Transcript_28187:62-349(+)|eukprot:scaffold302110_cov27-Tisochrysis_lutea.AAC.2